MPVTVHGKLTPDEIEILDGITTQRSAAEDTLRVALNFHQNTCSRLGKDADKLWDRLLDPRGLGRDVDYRVEKVNGYSQIVSGDDK